MKKNIARVICISKYCLKVVKPNLCKIELGGFKSFQILPQRKVGCLDISSFATIKVTNFYKYQPRSGSNHLLSAKSSKINKPVSVCHIKLL